MQGPERDPLARFRKHLGREAQLADALQGAGESHHRVGVGGRHGRVSALALHDQAVALERLFGDTDLHRFHAREIGSHGQTAALVQCQLGIDEVAMVPRQPVRSGQTTRLLARGKGDDEIAR